MRQSGEAFSSPNETPSELLCGSLHPSPHDMRKPPILLVSLSSANPWQGAREHFPCCPPLVRFPSCHRRRTLPIALRQTLATSFARFCKGHSQRLVRTYKVIVGTSPFQISQELWGLLSRGPGAACERCHDMTDRQIHPFNKSRVQLPG